MNVHCPPCAVAAIKGAAAGVTIVGGTIAAYEAA